MHDLTTIKTPDDWSVAKDLEYFDELMGPAKDNAEKLFSDFAFHYGSLTEVIDLAIERFQQLNLTQVAIPPHCLSLVEKIERLIKIATALDNGKFQVRLLDDLIACRWVEAERQRVLAEYQAAGEHGWLFPVIDLIDWIGWAAATLHDTIRYGDDVSFPFKKPGGPTQ